MPEDFRPRIVSAFKGWRYTEAANLSKYFAGRSGLSADLIFKNNAHRLAILIRETPEIPEYLTTMLTRKKLPKNFQLGIVSTTSQFIGFENIRAAIEHGIKIYRVSKNDVSIYVDPARVDTLSRVKSSRIKKEHDRQKIKGIPLAIIQEIAGSKNLRYSQILRRFAADYEGRHFVAEEENTFILACIKRLLRETLPDSDSVKSIEVLETLERFMQREGIRDHFLHSFQVFLLGCIILDYHYGKFSAWYSNCFGGSSSVKIEDTWLLASLLHDAKYPFQNISKWSGLGPGTGYAIKLETPRRRAQLLGSLFQHSRRMKTKNTWHSDLVDRLRNPDIEKIAIAQVSPSSPNLPNHAAISSFSLLAKESILPPVIFCQEICPAALAIFLHDSAVWSDMTKAGNLLPLEMKQFPLAFLLIYCDGLQEWGRRSGNDPQGKNSCLLDLKIDEKSVTTRIWFNDPANAIMMEVQHARILNEIVVPSEIDFKCEVNITSPVATKPIR